MMKRTKQFGVTYFSCALLWLGSGNTVLAQKDSKLSAMEQKMFSHVYTDEPIENRLARLEKLVFGSAESGTIEHRIGALSAACTVPTGTKEGVSASHNASASGDAVAYEDYSGDGFWDGFKEVMDEPAYGLPDSPGFVIRFLYYRAYHNPIAITLIGNGAKIQLRSRELNMEKVTAPKQFAVNQQKDCSKENLDQAKSLLSQSNFWDLPTGKSHHLDADTRWYVEVWDHKHHVVERQCGEEIRSVCEYLIKLSGLAPTDGQLD